jgi:molecular chaperone DnaK (HSP70)
VLNIPIGSNPNDCLPVVVGIDFGTAYSGVAYSYECSPSAIQFGAPSVRERVHVKAPTSVLINADGTYLFGHDAEMAYNDQLVNHEDGHQLAAEMYKNFKLLLKDRNSGFDTIMAKSCAGVEHSLLDLTAKCLTQLKDFAMENVRAGYGIDVEPTNDVQWVLTVPAIWNDFGKAFMRRAAFLAGLVSFEQSDNLMLVLEPEAAALAVHAGAAQHGLLGVGSRFMVLDCGGGTIDIATYDVDRVSPLQLTVVAAPAGGAWGGECINAEFRNFLRAFLGPQLYPHHGKLCGLQYIDGEFEKLKLLLEPMRENAGIIRLADVVENKRQLAELTELWNSKFPTKKVIVTPQLGQRGYLTMSNELMQSFFEPSLSATVAETRRALRAAPGVRHIVVVGGYAASKPLAQRIVSEFARGGVRVILSDQNPKPQAAIALGAVYFGLYKEAIQTRVAPYYYGVQMRVRGVEDSFSLIICKGEKLKADHTVALLGLPNTDEQEIITWCVFRSKGGPDDTVPPELTKGLVCLGTVSAPCPKHADLYERRQFAQFHFGGPEIKVSIENAHGDVTRAAIDMV